jgi:hypothetical protein
MFLKTKPMLVKLELKVTKLFFIHSHLREPWKNISLIKKITLKLPFTGYRLTLYKFTPKFMFFENLMLKSTFN